MITEEKKVPEQTEFLNFCIQHIESVINAGGTAGLIPQLFMKDDTGAIAACVFEPSFLDSSSKKNELADAIRDILNKRKGHVKEYCFTTEAWHAKSESVPPEWMRLVMIGRMAVGDLPRRYRVECIMLHYVYFNDDGSQSQWTGTRAFSRYPDGTLEHWEDIEWLLSTDKSGFQGRFSNLS